MEKRKKMKIIVMLVIAIILGLFVVSVTAQTVSQYRHRCHDWDDLQGRNDSIPSSSRGCCGWQYQSCWSLWPFS